MKRRKNSDVFFGAYIDASGKEKDITSKVKHQIKKEGNHVTNRV
jgi:Trm5-related predicted tRNA methylase